MKYTTANLLTQISNRITNALGKISKTVLGAMLSDMADSSVKLIGNETIEGQKTFSTFPILPLADPTGREPVSADYLASRLKGGLQKQIEIIRTEEIVAGGSAIIEWDKTVDNLVINSIHVFSCRNNQTGATVLDACVIRIVENPAQPSGLDILHREDCEVSTVGLYDDQANNDELSLYSANNLSENDLIRIDNDGVADDQTDYSTIQSIAGSDLVLNEPTNNLYPMNNYVRGCKKLNYKGVIVSDELLQIEVTNTGTDCTFGLIINYSLL